jgi:hypothetical protein
MPIRQWAGERVLHFDFGKQPKIKYLFADEALRRNVWPRLQLQVHQKDRQQRFRMAWLPPPHPPEPFMSAYSPTTPMYQGK